MEKFCKRCGEEFGELLADGYDPYTGKRNTKMTCVNPLCVVGCGQLTGHKSKWWVPFNWDCRLCGAKDVFFPDMGGTF